MTSHQKNKHKPGKMHAVTSHVCAHAIVHMEEPIRGRGWETCSSRAPALDADTHLHLHS